MLVVADTIWQERKFLLNVSIEAWTRQGPFAVATHGWQRKELRVSNNSLNIVLAWWVRDNAKCPRRQTRDGAHGKLQGS